MVKPWKVSSQQRIIPSNIQKPDYAESGQVSSVKFVGQDKVEIKNKNEITHMRNSCKLAKWILDQARNYIQSGRTTEELDNIIHEMIISNGAYPSPLNYCGFPKSICTSINNVACHGIPDNRPLQKGDILNVDITVYFNGYHGDCSTMFNVDGGCDPEGERLITVTELCLMMAIKICKPNENISSIGNIIEEIANKHGYNVIPAFTGHGIGTYFHGAPDIYHFANNFYGKMEPGMTFTIEPVLGQGSKEVEILEDGWTAVTLDNSRTAQVEHTILITNGGCEILTK